MIGNAAGGAAMYQAMTALGFAQASPFAGPIKLEGAPKGASVLILGAGVAGLVGAYELRKAGYKVKVLEFNHRAGGRAWTIRGGDEYTELGGAVQHCGFDAGLYINPGPWRLPFHHHGILHYARTLKVPLEPFIQVNYNAYLHSSKAFGGRPQRFRHVQTDYQGHVAELLAKAVNQGGLDGPVSAEDKEKLLESLKDWGALNAEYRYVAGTESSLRRGYDVYPGGGLMPAPVPSTPLNASALLQSELWRNITAGNEYEHHSAIFQPVGGMDRVALAIYREVEDLVQFGAKVTRIDQDASGVTVTYTDNPGPGSAVHTAKADWCLCTIPLSILSQIEITVGEPMKEAIDAVPYDASVKIGLQFKRRFWEQDDDIYGGITYTDLPVQILGYPATGYGSTGKGVMLGAYIWETQAYEFSSMTPQQRIAAALEYGSKIHPQYKAEFDNGIAVAWHRVPFINGCYGLWTDATRDKHYKNLCQIDGRIVLAGEHASLVPAWQEGAVLSSLDAISRLHQRVMAS
jgi:monoamine oxidase